MATKRYPDELRERAVRMVIELREQDPRDRSIFSRVARQLGVGSESLRSWVKQADIDGGKRPGVTTEDSARIKELEREVAELRRTNEILKAASAFFAQEADPHRRK
jgi:transposase